MKFFVITVTGFLILSFVLFIGSCKKETDCKAVVKCVNTSGVPVSGASVYLYAPVKTYSGSSTVTYTGDVTASGTTDAGGSVSFTFKLPATFNIRAKASVDTVPISSDEAVIKLEEGKTIDKTITLKP